MLDDTDDIIDAMLVLCSEAPAFTPRHLTNVNNKWLVKSALQKSIRRGDTETALRMGEYCYTADPQYCWSGLATIIVEDIGFGDYDLVSFSTLCTLKSIRDKVEPEMLYAGMIKRACEATKSRACCELSLGCDLQRPADDKPPWPTVSSVPHLWQSVEAKTDMDLLQYLDDKDMYTQYIAAVLLRKRLRNKGADPLNDALSVIHGNTTGFTAQRACMLSFERTVDTMNLAMYPTTRFYQSLDQSLLNVLDDVLDDSPTIRTVPAYAYDMHTMQGNKASRMFHQYLCQHDDRFKLIPSDDTKRPMGCMLFIVEGGLVSKRLVGLGLDTLKNFQDFNFMHGFGVPLEIANRETLAIVQQRLPALHDFRKKAAQ